MTATELHVPDDKILFGGRGGGGSHGEFPCVMNTMRKKIINETRQKEAKRGLREEENVEGKVREKEIGKRKKREKNGRRGKNRKHEIYIQDKGKQGREA